ncbi:hypothetical protein [Virgisporangium aliadipatigenens]|uniref:hypothetical protein n=1 Tax=Virgisporangium aliadipatigenens TaxID=741659 RepID=UPI0019412501|nr:hypothetical protein [Virgisporangium aliadipatigenens]
MSTFTAPPGVGVPPPPAGPGVAPPFAAPPSDKNKRSLWIGLGVGGLVMVLCCIGSVVGIGVVYAGAMETTKRQAAALVTEYLKRVQGEDYGAARALFCKELQAEVSTSRLATRYRDRPFTSFRVGTASVAAEISVTATLVTDGGDITEKYYFATAENPTADATLSICDIE